MKNPLPFFRQIASAQARSVPFRRTSLTVRLTQHGLPAVALLAVAVVTVMAVDLRAETPVPAGMPETSEKPATGSGRVPLVAPRPGSLRLVRERIQPEDVQRHIEWLASPQLAGRSGEGARIASSRIAEWFSQCGLQPLFPGSSWFQDIPGPSRDGNPTIAGRNVGGWIRGSDPVLQHEFVIVSAHYDHLGIRNGQIYPGADDNASGTSMMLEVARHLGKTKQRPRRSVVFVGFDLEERMLWGSRWFAAHPPWPIEQVCCFITADMIGRSLGDLPLPTVFVMGSEHSAQLRQALDTVPVPTGLEAARLGIDLVGTRSDYGPFRDREIPFLFFSTGEHPDYHTPQDVPDRVNFEKVAKVSSLVLSLTEQVASSDVRPVWQQIEGPDLEEARAIHRISELLLNVQGRNQLNGVQRLLVSHARGKTSSILERGEMTLAERGWLIRTAQLMLLSVF
ncbi:MAG: M28 family peptidase [Planctomycetaceae bacterium]|nr:M28 family peptidase [Planctomycetaceae bacterium]